MNKIYLVVEEWGDHGGNDYDDYCSWEQNILGYFSNRDLAQEYVHRIVARKEENEKSIVTQIDRYRLVCEAHGQKAKDALQAYKKRGGEMWPYSKEYAQFKQESPEPEKPSWERFYPEGVRFEIVEVAALD